MKSTKNQTKIVSRSSASKSTVILILLFILMISITIRFPYMYCYHEKGADTFYHHRMANVLITFHQWTWLLHPLSLWGLYPYSDSPASPFIVAETSLVSGLPIESSIILYDYAFMFLGIVSAFLLGLKIKRNLLFASILAISISLAPKAVYPDIFSLNERVALVLFLPFVMLLMYYLISESVEKGTKYKVMVILIPALFVMSTIHLISIFFIPFIVSIPIVMLFKLKKFKLIHISKKVKSFAILGIFILSFYSLFILNNYINIQGFDLATYKKTALFEGMDPLTISLNIGVSIVGGAGILLIIFGVIGGLYLIFKKIKSNFENYFIASVILLMPFIINRLYIRPFLILIVAIVSAYGAIYIEKHLQKMRGIDKKKAFVAIFMTAIIVSLPFTGFMMQRWDSPSPASKIPKGMGEQSYMIAVWMNKHTELSDIFVSNNEVVGGRVEAYSNRIMMPGMYSTDLDNLVFYKLYRNTSELGIKFNPNFDSKNIFTNSKKWRTFITDYVKLISSNKEKSIIILEKYNVSYFLYFTKKGKVWSDWYDQRLHPSTFCEDIPERDYTIYENEWYRYIYLSY